MLLLVELNMFRLFLDLLFISKKIKFGINFIYSWKIIKKLLFWAKNKMERKKFKKYLKIIIENYYIYNNLLK